MGLNSIQLLLPVVALLEKDFSSLISDIADTYSIPYSLFCFELIESSICHYGQRIIQGMNEFRSKGFRFSLSDYGIGNTNISLLLKMPLSSVCMETDFVKKIAFSDVENENNNSTIKKTETVLLCSVDLLNRLNLNIHAKNIDSIEDVQYATKFKSSFLEGKFFSEELSGPEVVQLLGGAK